MHTSCSDLNQTLYIRKADTTTGGDDGNLFKKDDRLFQKARLRGRTKNQLECDTMTFGCSGVPDIAPTHNLTNQPTNLSCLK